MVVGDAVGVFLAATETHQPASGVENVITFVQGGNSNLGFITDATTDRAIVGWDPAVSLNMDQHKIFISNTNFIETPASSTGFISGIVTNV